MDYSSAVLARKIQKVSKYTIVHKMVWKENKLPSCPFSRKDIDA